MGLTGRIVATYRDPGGALAGMLAGPRREDRLFAILMAACGFLFLAQWPRLAAEGGAGSAGLPPFEARVAAALFATLFVLPLCLYALAAASRWAFRLMGGRGSHYGARAALFWALLCIAPLVLAQGAIAGAAGPGAARAASGAVVFALFLWLWLGGLRAAEFGGRS
ncbi:MAG: YIP1 family protein [Paracoccaceae bacterium]